MKRPGLLRLSSVPVDTCPKEKSVIPRSHSHPGCLGKLSKEPMVENKPVAVPKKCFMEWIKKKKLEKGGYGMYFSSPISKIFNRNMWIFFFILLQCDYCKQGTIDNVDRSDYRKI